MCKCEQLSKKNKNTGLIECYNRDPPLNFNNNQDICPFIYKGECYQNCPEGSCLSQNSNGLGLRQSFLVRFYHVGYHGVKQRAVRRRAPSCR